MFISVVIPTYNRLPILQKCLRAMEQQQWSPLSPIDDYEIVVVDDGSTDGTLDWLAAEADRLPHVRTIEQNHRGPAAARNLGLAASRGDTIVFIDSDLVVLADFLDCHARSLKAAQTQAGNDAFFTYGRVVNTCNFEQPTIEPFKITDLSRAFFATGNVAIAKHWLDRAGAFDERFTLYGWEDLELGVRLKQLGVKLVPCPAAVGYHWHPPFSLEEIPGLIRRELERGRMGIEFYRKHPTWNVRLMIQMTWLHVALWGLLSLGGRLNERTLRPLLQWLIDRNRPQLALELARVFLNWYNVQAVYQARSATPTAE
ncbi:MAG: glycosyltransferase [Oscillatoriales cyanobacterium]|nr:MAG: glycosyltransferase [Oscillatoriales cyanobacterium]